ncbi:hypothetical protein [Cellulomonas fimi]|uniref:hypothetical protein n=1 Tax=Cellulomonas fimi TaxID=1708 RepID=UPI002359D618|nr:hypothetical protein [Cellulomonas fimi]
MAVIGFAVLRAATRGSTVIAVAAVLAVGGAVWLVVDSLRRRRRRALAPLDRAPADGTR